MGKRKACALLLAGLALMFALAGLAGCGGDGASGKGALRVGVRSDIVNFGYLNEQTGKYYGLEIDIADEMARRMGYAGAEFVTVSPETRKEMLQNGEVDCLLACYSISSTRLENFDFSPAYYTDSSVVMVEKSSLIAGIDQMKGCTFGAMSGSNTAPELIKALQATGFTASDIDVTTAKLESHNEFDAFALDQIESYEALSVALEEGLVDAACMDGAIAQTYLNDDRFLLDFDIATQEYGVATQKGSELSQPAADTIQAMLDDGTIAALIDKWN